LVWDSDRLKIDVLEVVEFRESLRDFFACGIAKAHEHRADLFILFSCEGLCFVELV
jgi:hypothetical protein